MAVAGIPGLIRWVPNLPLKAGERVAAPNGDIVTVNADFTTGAVYNAANFTQSTQAARIGTAETNIDVRGLPQRELVTGEDINNIREPGLYTCPSTTVAATLVNWPATGFTGSLFVGKAKAGNFTTQEVVALVSTVAPPDRYSRTTRASTNTSWTPWGYGSWARGAMPDGTNLDTFRESGVWVHATPSALTGLPADVTSGRISVENNVSAKTGIALQRLTHEDGRVYTRTASVLAGWAGILWKPVGTGGGSTPVTVVSDSGLINSVLIQNFTQQMGGRKKVTTATVAFRFDHGLANFNAIVRAMLESNNWKYSLALCSARWGFPENTGVTPEMVNTWVAAGLAEIWNHSKDHGSGDNSEASWKAAILDGLNELQTQIPAAAGKIFGFAPPGSAGTDFGGFIDGTTLDQFLDTDGMRFLAKLHAVIAGYLAIERVQDGVVRHGMGHITIDNRDLAYVQGFVEDAKAGKTALQIMLHPSRLNTEGYMTTATLTSIYDYLRTEELAGRIKIVSPYEQLLCDVV